MNKALTIVFTSLLSIDGILTYWAINTGQFIEQNPLMAPVAGSPLFVIYKVATALLAAAVVTFFLSRFPRVRRVVTVGLSLGSAFYLVILTMNLVEVFKVF